MKLMQVLLSLTEEVNGDKLMGMPVFKSLADSQPRLAKDLETYVKRKDWRGFITYCNEIIAANQAKKTSAVLPKLTQAEWNSVLQLTAAIKKEDPSLKNVSTLRKDHSVWGDHKVMMRESKDETAALVEDLDYLCEELMLMENAARVLTKLGRF